MKIKMKWQVTGLMFTAHQIAQRSALDPTQMVPTGKTVQEVRIEPLPFQEPSLPGEVNPIPDRCQLPNAELKFQIMNPDALGLDLLTPGQCVYLTIEAAPAPAQPRN